MKVFLRYISKSMWEKKGRLFLLVFSIAISTALLVGSLGLVDVLTDSFLAPYEASREGMDVAFFSSDTPFFSLDELTEDLPEGTSLYETNGELAATGVIEDDGRLIYVRLHGRTACSGSLVDGNADFLQTESPDEASCIISKRIADSRNLSAGDTITLYLSGSEKQLTISAICANENLFQTDQKTSFSILVPYSYLNSELSAEGKFNYLTARLSEGETKAKEIEQFTEEFNTSSARFTAMSLDTSHLHVDSSIQVALYMMLAIVMIVSAIIIHGVFKLVVTERLSIIGTFMSQGATKKKVERIILMEGFLYGILGGLAGCTLGEVLLFFLGRWISPLAEYKIYPAFHVNPTYILIGIIFAILLSVLSAWTPVRSVRRLVAKDVILNRVEASNKNKWIKWIVGAVLLGFSITVSIIWGRSANSSTLIGMFSAFAGIILLTPLLVKLIAGVLARLCRGNTTLYLAINNIRTSKLLRSNIVLIVVSLSASLMLSSFGKSMASTVVDAYETMNYDYSIDGIMESSGQDATTDMILEKLRSIPEIDNSSITTMYFALVETDDTEAYLMGSDPEALRDVTDGYFHLTTEYREDFEAYLNGGENSVLLPIKVARKVHKKAGDTIEFTMNGKKATFTVAGIYDGRVYNGGLCVFIRPEALRKAFGVREAEEIVFRLSGNAEAAEEAFRPFLTSLGATYSTIEEDRQDNVESNQMIVDILSIFTWLAMIIASIGVFNNITISFYQRKRELAVMASVGMDKGGRTKLVLTESILCVLFSLLITIPFTILLCKLMTGISIYIELPLNILFSWVIFPGYAAIITVITLIATLSTVKKTRRLSVVQELKYE